MTTDRILQILEANGVREVTIESRITAYLQGQYQTTIDEHTHVMSGTGGRTMRMGGTSLNLRTGQEPLIGESLQALHTDLLAR